jgi:hypothetical protein
MGDVDFLAPEETTILLGSLTACGFLVLGILEALCPPAPSRRASPLAPSEPPAVSPAVLEPPAPHDIPLPPPPSAVSVGRMLMERARAESDLERRVTIVTRAVAGLSRAARNAPDDLELDATVAAARELLWETWERIALTRLAAAMPWGAAALVAPPREPHLAALARSA